MIINKKMKKIMKKVDEAELNKTLKIKFHNLKKLLEPNFVVVRDCILIAEENSAELEKHFDSAMELYTNKAYYEANCSDTRVNDYIKNDICEEMAISLGIMAINAWSRQLKHIDSNSKFCFIMTCDDGYVTIRYHKIRSGEVQWLVDNIEEYEDAVGYIIE